MSYPIPNQRLAQQIQFILEVDKLKNIIRRTYINGSGRRENSAEHSWQLALMALTLAEHANEPVDVARVMKMVVIHDIVEIDAGDTYFFDDVGAADKAEREQAAAARLFGFLPDDQAFELKQLWEEFEARRTPFLPMPSTGLCRCYSIMRRRANLGRNMASTARIFCRAWPMSAAGRRRFGS